MMTSILTRACCAMLSIVGAAGLVAFADPANVPGTAKTAPVAMAVAAAGPIAVAHRG